MKSSKRSRASRIALGGLALAGGLTAAALAVGYALSAPGYRGSPSDHFDGTRFRNLEESPQRGLAGFLLGRLTGRGGAWRDGLAPPDVPAARPRSDTVGADEMRVTWVGHATVLVQAAGFNILTDPIWSERASPFSFAGPRRVREPGVAFENLPPIHLVVLSHNHYDHTDLPTLRRLARDHRPRFVVPLGNKVLLERERIADVVELDWWQSTDVTRGGDEAARPLRVTLAPTQHQSGRGLFDRNHTLWGGYVIESGAGRIYFAGDTGYGAHFRRTGERFAGFRLAVLPIGAHLPREVMRPVHTSPEEAVRAHRDLGAETSVAIHFGTFPLAEDGETEPVDELRRVLASQPDMRFFVLGIGESRDIVNAK